MALSKKHLKQLLSKCHWPADNKLWNIVKDQRYSFFLARAKEALQTAEDTCEPAETERQLILAIRMLNLARASVPPVPGTAALPPLEQRQSSTEKFHEPGDKPTASC